ncbi:MAG: hypothetical protein R3B48_00080 [Kofleriaceae bacterium]
MHRSPALVVYSAGLMSLVFAALAAVAHAEPLRVAVIPGVAINLDPPRVDALSQDLAEALSAELEVEALGGLEVRRRLPAEGIDEDCAVTPACAAALASRLEVAQLLFIVLVDTGPGGSIQVDTTWVEPSSGRRVTRPAIDLATVETARERFAASAAKLLPEAAVRKRATPAAPATAPPRGPRHFTRTSYLTAAATAVSLGVGVGFGLTARSRYHACEDTLCSDERKSSIRTLAAVADVGFGLALAGAVATAVLYGTSAEAPRLTVSPMRDGVSVLGGVEF